jgi:uncharacterized protein (TIGR02453 family)
METTLHFLKKLKINNNREWFDSNKPEYLASKEIFEEFVSELIKGINKFDKKVSLDLKPKDCTFRIYKDVRFSKDKTPYKNNMSASINPGGKKSNIPGYYFHLEPDACFLAGGVYMPMPDVLKAIRQEIDYNPLPLINVLKSASFKKEFNGLDEEDKLKNPPKGFNKDHAHSEILKNRHFIVSQKFENKVILKKEGLSKTLDSFKAMYPFLDYLRKAIG